MRAKILNSAIIFTFLFIISAIFNLQLMQGKEFKYLSDKNCIRLLSQGGSRGKILDRNGNVIVANRLSYDVTLLPQEQNQADKALTAVSKVTGVNFGELKERFKNGYLAPFVPVTVVSNIGIKEAVTLGELKSDYSSIVIQSKPLRDYPYGKLACHLIGYLGEIDHWRLTKLEDYGYKTKDTVGFGGIEEKYDYYLRQKDGGLSVEVDHLGRFVRVLGFKPGRDGLDIKLTLDLKAQKIAEDALSERKGSVILIEPSSGEIIALANNPAFNPAIFVNKQNRAISSLGDSALINRSISAAYPLGSVFKLITACAGLETGKINLSTTYSCSGSTRIGNRDFKCWDKHNIVNLAQAIARSCDVFFYRTGLLSGPKTLYDYALKFGLSRPTGIDLPYETSGFVPDPLWKSIYKFRSWYPGDTANFAIGQGDLLITPLQAARLMAVFANRGTLVNPHILKTIGDKDVSKQQKKNSPLPIKATVISTIRQYLRGVVSDPSGTASVLSGLALSVAGKTGTAQAGRGHTHGWFAGFFPFDEPKFVICVFLENNGSGHAASALVKQIIEEMVKEGLI